MTDPLTSINAEELEKNVNEAYKTMHKSVKLFNDIPSKYEHKYGLLYIELCQHMITFRSDDKNDYNDLFSHILVVLLIYQILLS